jgi:hypothetical protein
LGGTREVFDRRNMQVSCVCGMQLPDRTFVDVVGVVGVVGMAPCGWDRWGVAGRGSGTKHQP